MEERSKQVKQTNNKAKQHSTPEAVTFSKKNELLRVGLEPTTLYTLDRALYGSHSSMKELSLFWHRCIIISRGTLDGAYIYETHVIVVVLYNYLQS